jgi:SAM-dependent methyltransferase
MADSRTTSDVVAPGLPPSSKTSADRRSFSGGGQPRGRLRAVVTLVVFALACATLVAQERRHGRIFPPKSLGELEGPDREAWQKPEQIMDALGIADRSVVADIGAGGGWFTVRLARRVGPQGVVYAEDVQREMIEAIERRMQREGLRNVRTVLGTLDDPKLPPRALNAVLIVDVYHEVESRVELLRNVRNALTPSGRLGIVDFSKDGWGPGPPMDERLDEALVVKDAIAAGLRLISRETFLPYQYLLVFGK